MATYYVRKTGLDTNGGTSAATAWLTVGKALGSTGIASGDTLYIGAGIYRETVSAAMTAPSVATSIYGDTDGAKTGDSGEVIITAYTTSDTATPSTTQTLNLNGRSYLNFYNLTIIGANCYGSFLTAYSGETNWSFNRCAFYAYAGNAGAALFTNGGTAAGASFNDCLFETNGGSGIEMYPTLWSGADYDVGYSWKRCRFSGSAGQSVYFGATSGTGAGKPGGGLFQECNFESGQTSLRVDSASYSTTVTAKIYNSIIKNGQAVSIYANTAGQVVEDYNLVMGAGARTNVTAGTNSKTMAACAPMYSIGQEWLIKNQPRPLGTPLAVSPLRGLGQNGTYASATDFTGRSRPNSLASAVNNAPGYVERHDIAARETGTVHTASSAINLTGPGDHDFAVPVDAVSTIIAVYCQYDTNHGTTNPPQMIVTNGTECGVADATTTAPATAGAWSQLSLTIVPTAKGVVTVRLVSRAAAATGKAFFDDFSIT